MFRSGGATRYKWNERNFNFKVEVSTKKQINTMDFSAFFNYMKLERAKMKLALVLRNNYIA